MNNHITRSTPFITSTKLLALTMSLTLAGLTGCGNKPAPEAEKPQEKTAQTADKAKSNTTELAEKQEITLNNSAEPESLDPQKVSGVPESNIIRQILVGLTTTAPDGSTIAGMAEKWESADNKVWTFSLRDAQWSNGDAVTAQDFVYSLQRLVNPETASPYASYLTDAKVVNAQDIIDGKASFDTLGVKAIDAKTLEITLSEPVPYFPDVMIHTSVKPVHKATVEKFAEKWTAVDNIVVNGAYTLDEWSVNDKIVLKRNTAYYDDANTTINKVTLLPIPESTTDVTRYKAGEIDVTSDELPSEQFTQLQETLGSELSISPNLCSYYYEFNLTKAPFNDVKVRRALALALDRDIITGKVLAQGQTPAYQFTPPATQGGVSNTPEWQALSKEQRIEQAKTLLAEAGYSESKPLKFELLYNTSESHKKVAVAATALWKEALGNVDITLTNKEWKTYLDTRRSGDYDISRAGWCGDYNEASTFLNVLKTGNSNNHGKYVSSTFDGLMAKTLQAGIDSSERTNLYNQAEAQMDADMPFINIYHYVSPRLVKPYVLNFPIHDPLNNWQIKDVSIAQH